MQALGRPGPHGSAPAVIDPDAKRELPNLFALR